jgi:hypothetical protein
MPSAYARHAECFSREDERRLAPDECGYFAGTADSSFQFVRIVVAWQYVFVQLGPLRHERTSRQAALAVPPCVGTVSTHFPE